MGVLSSFSYGSLSFRLLLLFFPVLFDLPIFLESRGSIFLFFSEGEVEVKREREREGGRENERY